MPRTLAIDAGTTGITALVITDHARVEARGYREFQQHFPRPGWVEHDAREIWDATLTATRTALDAAGIRARDCAAIGITNQRETTVIWDRKTLEPIANAIVWQDRRTAPRCDGLREHEPSIRALTGLVLDATSAPRRSSGCSRTRRARANAPTKASSPSAPSTRGSSPS
jgi:glycerol kinase